MTKSFKDILAQAKTVRLTEREKANGLRVLSAFTETHPVAQQTVTSRFTFQSVWVRSLTGVVGVVLLFVGIASASQKSLPGEALYSMKVGIVEPLQAVLTFSPESKASWQGELAVRRLTESETLLAQGKLDEARKTELETSFEKHVALATQQLEVAGDSAKALSVSFDVEAKLRAHRESSRQVATLDAAAPQAASLRTAAPMMLSAPAPSAKMFAAGIVAGGTETHEEQPLDKAINQLAELRAKTTERATSASAGEVRATAERLLKSVAEDIADAKKQFSKKQEKLSADEQLRVSEKIALADLQFGFGKDKMATSTPDEAASAIGFLQEARSAAQEAKYLLGIYLEAGVGKDDAVGFSPPPFMPKAVSSGEIDPRFLGASKCISKKYPVRPQQDSRISMDDFLKYSRECYEQAGIRAGIPPAPTKDFSSKADCEQKTSKQCEPWMCDYIPPGKTVEEVCPNGGQGWSPVQRSKNNGEGPSLMGD